jgi:hypothetical protein
VTARHTNLALLVVLVAALVTGAFALSAGTAWGGAVVLMHGLTGLSAIVLSPWKSVIVRRGLRRRRPGRAASVALMALVLLSVAAGLAHTTGAAGLPGLTAMQIHVGAALLAVPFAVRHVLARRVRPRPTDLSRRTLLRGGTLLAVAGVAYGAWEAMLRAGGLPGASRRFTGSHEAGSHRPAAMPVTQWLDDRVPAIDPQGWRLQTTARSWSLEELGRAGDRVRATLDCTGGWYAEQDWTGIRVDRLLGQPGSRVDGRSIVVRSSTGYTRRFPVRDASRLLLATRVGGEPLSAGHGAPARLVAPGRRGFWWVKWVDAIDTDLLPWWWQSPFPLT